MDTLWTCRLGTLVQPAFQEFQGTLNPLLYAPQVTWGGFFHNRKKQTHNGPVSSSKRQVALGFRRIAIMSIIGPCPEPSPARLSGSLPPEPRVLLNYWNRKRHFSYSPGHHSLSKASSTSAGVGSAFALAARSSGGCQRAVADSGLPSPPGGSGVSSHRRWWR